MTSHQEDELAFNLLLIGVAIFFFSVAVCEILQP